jgi:hypothetical protein
MVRMAAELGLVAVTAVEYPLYGGPSCWRSHERDLGGEIRGRALPV